MSDRLIRVVHWMFRGTASLLGSEWSVVVALGYVLAVMLLLITIMSLPFAVMVERVRDYEKLAEGKQN